MDFHSGCLLLSLSRLFYSDSDDESEFAYSTSSECSDNAKNATYSKEETTVIISYPALGHTTQLLLLHYGCKAFRRFGVIQSVLWRMFSTVG